MAKAESLSAAPDGSFAAAGRKVLNWKLDGLPRPLTLGEVASRSDDGEGKPADKNTPRKFRLSLLKVYPIVSSS